MFSHYLNGQWIKGSGAAWHTVDPSNGMQLWSGTAPSEVEVELACQAARDSFPIWAATALEQRIDLCLRFRDLLKEDAEALAHLIALEVGKPLWEARSEVTSMINKVDISVQAYHARTGHVSTKVADGESVLRHRPHGVFAVFGPYNFPGHLPNGHIVPALIAGNSIVFKPSEYAPQTAIKTVALWQRAGVPAGVLNLLNGGRDTGIALARNPQLDGILFTGSYQTGVQLHRQFAGRPDKMLALEMGGNNALVAWHIGAAELDAAVHHALLSAFASAGQRCTCARRLIVDDTAAGQRFIARLVEVAAQLRIGRFDQSPAPFMGPLVSLQAAEKLLAAYDGLLDHGGTALLKMRHLHEGSGFVSAGIIDVTAAAGIPDEEWFGPLLQVIRIPTFEAAIACANATKFGLAAALLSHDAALWQQFSQSVRAGVVNWNRPTTGAASSAPFGGVGQSGNHRPSAYYAADYCAYPVASIQNQALEMPAQLSPGLML
ncbi:MAG: succinylglutamate-semialdehyde dehydrogenase [Pseudomonadota bacterium]